ncbi:MAG: ribulokinase [Christensenellales bacterium]|jgi:L-ribulokinase
MSLYSIGIDFGSLSARALVVEVKTGKEIASHVSEYAHAVMDDFLPVGKGEESGKGGKKLPPDWALQHPQDYINSMAEVIKTAIEKAGIRKKDVIGVGIDFTACTLMSIKADGTPLCFLPEFEGEPHAYIKLWKHHAAQDHANRLNSMAEKMGEKWLQRYGGKISSEWMFPKIWQTLEEAPEVYARADMFIECADWMIMQLTGNVRRNSCTAGYKAIWHKAEGYPSKEFFRALDPRLENVVEEKLKGEIYPIGSYAGSVTKEAAEKFGLAEGTAVAVANVDAHVSLPAAGITDAGKLLMIMGTSTCHIVVGDEEKIAPGMCGVVEDGVLPGFFGYEAGQSCVGDHFDWFVKNCVPESYFQEARERKMNIHDLLTEKASAQRAGESGLLALDWWNGNRSVLVDVDLTGLMLGMTLQTKPEEIYRALIEATAYGTKMIIENFKKHGVPIDGLYACGGIADKNPMLMQIYSDVTGYDIRIARSSQSPALGSAMFGAVAAGKAKGGYDSITEAAAAMGGVKDLVYSPNAGESATYQRLYAQYETLHDYFGRGANDVMKELKAIRKQG